MSSASEEVRSEKRCSVCGRPCPDGSNQCSVGCALAARIPLGDDALPASWELFGFLGSGFVLFNQALFGVAAWAKRASGDWAASEGFATGSIVAGIVWLVMALFGWIASSPKRLRDVLVALAAVGVIVAPEFFAGGKTHLPDRFLIANLLIAIGLYRGVYYLWRASKKREK